MADTDRDQLDARALLYPLDDLPKVAFKVGAAVRRRGRIINRRAIRNHHQDASFLGPRNQSVVRPEQSLAVDILLEKPLAHHEAEVTARVAIGFVRALVDDVPQVIEPAGARRAPCCEPRLSALPAFPAPSGKAEDFCRNAATLESAREGVGANWGDRDGAPAHGS